MKKIAALSALAIMAAAGTASAQTFETRFLVQTISGSGAGRTVSNTAATMFNVGDRVRLTVQYRFTGGGLTDASQVALGSLLFDIQSSNAIGTASRSALTNGNPGAFLPNGLNAEDGTFGAAFGGFQSAASGGNGLLYPQTGESAISGLHVGQGNLRGFLAGGLDSASANGTVIGDDIRTILAGTSAANGGSFTATTANVWWGLYSMEFQNNAAGSTTFSVVLDPTADVRWYGPAGGSNVVFAGQRNLGSVTLQFGSANTAPTIAEVSPINGSPNFTPVPDINNVLIATVTDAEGILASQVMAMLNTGTPDNLGSLVFSTNQVDANTVQVFMSYEIVNSDLAGGPKSFTVKINANDGDLAAAQKIVTVNLVPAPGAAALLGLGGLIAARRRRA